MATETPVLGLELPAANDFYDVEKFNSNFRKIDAGTAPSIHAANHATNGSDPITPESIGAASKNLVESSLTIPQNTEDTASYLDNLLDEYIATKPNGSLGYVKIQCQAVHPTLGGGQYIASVFVIMQDYVSIEAIAYAAGPANNVVRKYTRSKSNGVWGEWTSDNAASYRPVYKEITLSASAWNSSAKTQTTTVSGVLADERKQLITPTPALESQAAYYDACILCTGQAINSLTFTAEKIPTDNLTVYVVIQVVNA